jgi:hypothetical protein
MTMIKSILSFLLVLPISVYSQTHIYTGVAGKINFKSDAPLELIQAQSDALSGAVNAGDKSFLFTVKMNSFKGFNSELQRTHFNENYVESEKYPKAKFEGKIIEDIDLTKPGTYTVRAKGNMEIHGVTQQRIIKSTITVSQGSILVKSKFTVLITEHKIQIPYVVKQKLAEEIFVEISILLKPKKT